jgi:hypothetical protein
MSLYNLQAMIRQEAIKATQSKNIVQLGIVSSFDPETFTAIVELYPADGTDAPALQTGSLPIFTSWAGPGWGMFGAPQLGEVVEVHYQEGSLQNGYVALQAQVGPPSAGVVNAGEFWLIHASGAVLKLTNDGSLNLESNVAINIIAPIVNIDTGASGALKLGNLAGALTGFMTAAAVAVYNSHTHSGVMSGSDTSAIPNELLSDSDLSTSVMGN